MQSDLGKLFIGGISWDTDENKLKEYFGQYGEVVEAMIMRDRTTNRARGFGFIVFADPVVAERVVMEKHMIDGRTVEAKKAVPRDDQQISNRNNNLIHGSPGPGPTKKIFVGGLASTVTESDFKKYFEQFGIITDVVVMYDHNTQRPRGFGFITYDSEDAVDSVLQQTFHQLNGKMVEVKRAVPKELSPGPSRSPLVGYGSYGMSRASNFINSYAQGYNLNSIAGYGRLNPLVTGRTGLPPFGNPGFGMSMNMEPGLNASYGANSNFSNSLGFGRALGPFFNGNSNRYNTPIGFNVGNTRGDSLANSAARNVWGNGSFSSPANPVSPGAFLGSGSGNFSASLGNNGANWSSSSSVSQGGSINPGYSSGNLGYGFNDGYGLGSEGYGRTHTSDSAPAATFAASTGGFDTPYGDLYRGGSGYGDSTWRSSSPELEGSGFGLGNAAADIASRTSDGLIGGYGAANRQANRGIAAYKRPFEHPSVRL
ncbi:heterogeneous nuclear ribonucleoprotein 1-like [Amaranthus tricolor]|uniref:heterogeneous nuclear ribonucleoprotein 1-like n=1 Tax=Amaranthus tricolor TaxID=29722 RepID=UPI0025911DDC|nr:heterogeneous nuclear ribonucleoprotein 1-like [Amaranthus tricolor]XP_057540510.1 heterogeneous nuclear ribonucleoprotein 1-like [Amaranthus tricolor]